MPESIEGNLLAGDTKIAIAVSRFNDFITSRLLDAAVHAYTQDGGQADQLTVVHVPGSFELPVTALKLAQSGRYEAVVCLGCVIRGATAHYDCIVQEVASGVGQVALQTGVPTIFGVITADTLEQAIERAGSKQGNQGAKAMLAAIEMANLFKQL